MKSCISSKGVTHYRKFLYIGQDRLIKKYRCIPSFQTNNSKNAPVDLPAKRNPSVINTFLL